MCGIFGDLFDFNGDGEMNTFERAAEFSFLDYLEREERAAAEEEDDDWDFDDDF